MARYLFIFGFETPLQARNNALHGWDDEDSRALWIEASSEDEAQLWGDMVAQKYVAQLFANEGWTADIPSWRDGNFARCIEANPTLRFSVDQLAAVPVVQVGEFLNPDGSIGE